MIARHLRFILVVVTCLSCSKPTKEVASNSTEVMVFPYFKQSFDWTSIEKSIDDTEKRRFTDSIHWLRSRYADTVYLSEIHSLDFNDDGLNDFIYSGLGPIDNWTTIVGINQGNELKYFDLDGRIVGIRLRDKKVGIIFTISIVGTSPGMFGHRIVDVDYKDNLPIFKTTFESEMVDWTPLPLDKESISYKFESIDDTIILRDSPIELDTPYNYFLDVDGNQFGKIVNGTQGQVIGQRTDSLQNAWLCVLIYPNRKLIGYPLYPNGVFDSTDRVNKIAWIRDRGIKRVD